MRSSNVSPDVDAALGLCHQAIFDPSLWPDAMNGIADALGLVGCCFNTPQARVRRLSLPASTRYKDMLQDFLAGGWAQYDLRAQRGWRLVEAEVDVICETMISSAEERARLPLYTDLLNRHDMSFYVGVGFVVDGQAWTLSGARADKIGAPLKREVEALRRLRPQLTRLIRYSERTRQHAEAGVLAGLEVCGHAAVLIDWRGSVSVATSAARTIFGRVLDVRGGRLVARDPATNATLQHLIAMATHRQTPWAGWPVVVRRDDELPLVIEAVPSRDVVADGLGLYGALLMITDLERSAERDVLLMRAALGFTRREAQIAVRLAAGENAPTIASGLGLRESSVHQVIKALMAKTGVDDRARLVAILTRIPGRRRNDS